MAEAKKAEGNAAYKARDFSTAVNLYSEAIDLDPENHLLYSNRAAANLVLENFEDVAQDCKKCLELEPDFIKAHLRLATALEGLKKHDEALEVISKALKIGKDGDKGKKELKKLAAKIKRVKISEDKSSRRAVERALMSGSDVPTKDLVKLQEELTRVVTQAGKIKRDLDLKATDIKRADLTRHQLEVLLDKSPDAVTYKSVGRMFVKQENQSLLSNISQNRSKMESEATTLAKAYEHFTNKIKSTRESLGELQR
mmetsp:Transcript_4006/g.4905  ORF Transcript_4006/g.4905 Transcript_4006/m.4905 type:complete len:255 (+) Transcript_4006:136-900(+)